MALSDKASRNLMVHFTFSFWTRVQNFCMLPITRCAHGLEPEAINQQTDDDPKVAKHHS